MAGNIELFGTNISEAYPQYGEAIDLLSEPATQQLLIYRATGETTSVSNTFLNADFRNKITFNSGDPQPSYQFVATSQGSECANGLFPPYQKLIDADADALLFILPVLVSYHFKTEVKVNALPITGLQSQISMTAVKSQFKLFGLINIYKDIYSEAAYAPGYQIPIDGAPGGKYGVYNAYVPTTNVFIPIPALLGILGYVYGYVSVPYLEFDFVPAGSALDVDPFNTGTLTQKFVGGANPNYPSTSETYIAQETFTDNGRTISNNQHIQFTARNSNWMFDRMENIPDALNCSSSCQPDYTISGDNTLCSNNGIYLIDGLAYGSTVNWSASPSDIVQINPLTDSSVMITALANGTITLTATISTCNQVITRAINIGAPSLSIVSEQTNTCTGSYQTWSLNATPPENGTNFTWSKGYIPPGSDIFIFNESGPFTFADVSGGGIVKLNYNDLCGTAKTDGVTIYSNCPGFDFQLFPNPAGNYVIINATAGINDSKNLIYGIRITDRSGKLRKNTEYKQGVSTTRISLNELNSGIYLVSVFDGVNWSSKQLVIEK